MAANVLQLPTPDQILDGYRQYLSQSELGARVRALSYSVQESPLDSEKLTRLLTAAFAYLQLLYGKGKGPGINCDTFPLRVLQQYGFDVIQSDTGLTLKQLGLAEC